MKKGKIGSQKNKVLIQSKITCIAEEFECQSVYHAGKGIVSTWELRGFQDIYALRNQGFTQQEQMDLSWEKACREQDFGDLHTYFAVLLCSECLEKSIGNMVGLSALRIAMLPIAIAGKGSFLIATDRVTETPFLIPLFGDIPDDQLLEKIRTTPYKTIHLKK